MATISTQADRVAGPAQGRALYVTGRRWLASLVEGIEKHSADTDLVVDLSDVSLISLFEWTVTCSLLERTFARSSPTCALWIDVVGTDSSYLVPYEVYRRHRKRTLREPSFTRQALAASGRAYRCAGFLNSIGTLSVLNQALRPDRTASLRYMSRQQLELHSYGDAFSSEPLLFGLTRVESKEDCTRFLDATNIQRWQQSMQERFASSPLLRDELLWRVVCHETAANIFEHSGSAGFLAARVVASPVDVAGKWKDLWAATYEGIHHLPSDLFSGGLLEICVSDMGAGISSTLRDTMVRQTSRQPGDIRNSDILAFAFDELGSCKSDSESWASERHALGRILGLVEAYGGVLRLISETAEVVYSTRGGWFERRPGRLGFEPTVSSTWSPAIPGTHIQVLLPLFPAVDAGDVGRTGRRLVEQLLPTGIAVDESQPIGHLVPLVEALEVRSGQHTSDARLSDVPQFRQSCEQLARDLLARRPPSETFVFDLSGISGWTDVQFESCLYYMQNCLSRRLVLLVEVPVNLVAAVQRHVWSRKDTTLRSDPAASPAPGAAGNSVGELPHSTFLGSLTLYGTALLAIDVEKQSHLLGVPSEGCEEALLSLIDHSNSIDGLCTHAWGSADLDETVIRKFLRPDSSLFRMTTHGNWTCAFTGAELAVESQRVITLHFNEIAARCGAWGSRDATDAGASTTCYYLPGHRQWVDSFLQSSRILERTRYADDIAQRLVSRILSNMKSDGRTIADVRILAYATTPAGLLAHAIQRWWPPAYEAPSVVDVGVQLMQQGTGMIDALPDAEGVLVVQDVVDTFVTTQNFVRRLAATRATVLGVVAMVELIRDFDAPEPSGTGGGGSTPSERPFSLCSLVTARSPASVQEPDGRAGAMWIEPRSLRPFAYEALGHAGSVVPWQPSRLTSDRSDLRSDVEQHLVTGHYVFGARHYIVRVDVDSLGRASAGRHIAEWLADVCEGRSGRSVDWESDRGLALTGDVSCVLMPLHSHAHSLWSQVEGILASRSRRQPYWQLEATMFVGSGPAVFPPAQLDDIIRDTIRQFLDRREHSGGASPDYS